MYTTSFDATDLDTVLEVLRSEIAEPRLQHDIDQPVKGVLDRFLAAGTQPCSRSGLHTILGQFVQASYRAVGMPSRRYTATDYAIDLLGRSYSPADPDACELAIMTVFAEHSDGLSTLLPELSSQLTQSLRAKHIHARMSIILEELPFTKRTQLVRSLVERHRDHLPERLTHYPPLMLVPDLPKMLQIELSVDHSLREHLTYNQI
jgi:hypothetical protein